MCVHDDEGPEEKRASWYRNMAAGDDGVPTDLTASWVGMPTPNSLRDRVRSWVTVEEEVPSPAAMPEPEPEPQQEAAAAAAAEEEEEEEEEQLAQD
eukprot:COSAG06_NODE_28418_length_574_cov_6.353684_1_plen_95_part_10